MLARTALFPPGVSRPPEYARGSSLGKEPLARAPGHSQSMLGWGAYLDDLARLLSQDPIPA
jgi:hypothetical protein